MIDLAREAEAGMVIADIGYSDARGYRMKQVLQDIFWEVSSNSPTVIEPRFEPLHHRIVCYKNRILKRHYVLLKDGRIMLPNDAEKIKIGGNLKTKNELWIEHHKNIKIKKNEDNTDELIIKGQDHLAITSAYCDLAYEYILKHSALREKQKRRGLIVHITGRRR
jgi:hypothetical protein